MTPTNVAAMPASASPKAPERPWYRQRWPWLLMAGPAIVVVASMVTIWLAATTDDAVVADDYYKRGLSINHRLERVDRAAALGLEAMAEFAADGRVRVALASPSADGDAHPAVIVLGIAHATRGGVDRSAELVLGPDGTYDGRIEPLGIGRWLVSLETKAWRLPAVEIAGETRTLKLRAPAALQAH
jgi:uncharacterized protein